MLGLAVALAVAVAKNKIVRRRSALINSLALKTVLGFIFERVKPISLSLSLSLLNNDTSQQSASFQCRKI